MRGLLLKSIRETRAMTVTVAAALAIATGVLTAVLPQIQKGLSDAILQMPFVRTMISAMAGIDASEGLTTMMLLSIVWTHPVVLALVWLHEIVYCTRFPAGEIDRGTIDVLLGWPVSRRQVYAAETMGWLGSGVVVAAAGLGAFLIASSFLDPAQRPPTMRVLAVDCNLLALYIAVGGIAMLCSALSDRRGRAIAVVFGIVAASVLLNFIAAFWSPAEAVKFLGVLDYYQPAAVIRDGGFPWGDVIVLIAIGAVTWLAGMEITARRSMCTV